MRAPTKQKNPALDLEDDPLLSLHDVEFFSGLNQRVIRRAVREKHLPFITLAGQPFVRQSWLSAWLEHGDGGEP